MKKGLLAALLISFALLLAGAMNVSTGWEFFKYPVTFADDVFTTHEVGTKGTDVTKVAEYGEGNFHKTVLTFDSDITLDDVAGASASGSTKLYTFPAGSIVILGASLDGDVDGTGGGISATADGDVAFGTSTCDTTSTLSSTEADIIASTAIAQLVTSTGVVNALKAAVSFHDGTTTAKDVYINILYDDADSSADGDINVSGVSTIYWLNQGDY